MKRLLVWAIDFALKAYDFGLKVAENDPLWRRQQRMDQQQKTIAEAAIVQKRYEDRISFQKGRINALMSFLSERGLVKEFCDWEQVKRNNAEADA